MPYSQNDVINRMARFVTVTACCFFFLSLFDSLQAWQSLGPLKAVKRAYRNGVEVEQPERTMRLVRVDDDDRAKCLDGSSPVYYIRKGFDDGADKFLIYLEGGGWCFWAEQYGDNMGINHCSYRRGTKLGGTLNDDRDMLTTPKGVLSSDPHENPDFYNWNLVFFRYCDGSSFSGTNEVPYTAENGEKIHFRGWFIFQAMINHLKNFQGLSNASKVVLTGTSAGGLATILRCDDVAQMVPSAKVKCIADTGFFIEARSVSGVSVLRFEYEELERLHKPRPSLGCKTEGNRPLSCWLPEYAAQHVKSDILLVQPGYDQWQVQHSFLSVAPDQLYGDDWAECAKDLRMCSQAQMATVNIFNWIMERALVDYLSAEGVNHSVFMHSCYVHGQMLWWPWHQIEVKNTLMQTAVSNFINGERVLLFDKQFGKNPSCDRKLKFNPS